jgi:uncharacterized membrane protein YdjX (TVP38/TMEM64 family)
MDDTKKSLKLKIIAGYLFPASIVAFSIIQSIFAPSRGIESFSIFFFVLLYVVIGLPSYIMTVIATLFNCDEKKWMIMGELCKCIPMFALAFLGSGTDSEGNRVLLGLAIDSGRYSPEMRMANASDSIFNVMAQWILIVSIVVVIVDLIFLGLYAKNGCFATL